MYDNLYFDRVDTFGCIKCYIKSKDDCLTSVAFHGNGCYNTFPNAKCVIFPKGKTTWEGFQRPFKDGDIVALESSLGVQVFIFKEYINAKNNHALCYVMLDICGTINIEYRDYCVGRFATEEEKQMLFKAIENNGYKWNEKTKTIEKLIKPIFKKGDKVRVKNGVSEPRMIDDVCDRFYTLVPIGSIAFTDQHNWELVPNKFDINTLIPFESKVLVRHNKDNKWTGSFFSFIDKDLHSHCYKFVTTADKSYPMMIPYKGNEYLLGKTDDCQEFYKTWQ